MAEGGDDPQRLKKIAAAAYEYDNDSRWVDYWSNILIPPHMASRPEVVEHYKRKFYQRYVDPDLVVEPMASSSSSSQSARPSASTNANEQARSRNSGSVPRTTGPSATSGVSSGRWDQQTIQFSVNAWVFVIAVLAVLPLVPKNLSNRAYRLSFMGTACSSLYSLYSLYGRPSAWNMQGMQVYFQSIMGAKDFIYFIYCLTFVTSHLCLKFALIPILCRALEQLAKFLRRNFARSTIYRKYLEDPCVWVESNTTTLNILSSQAEIAIGFLLIISLLSWQRNIIQTFMYWQLLKLMYQAPVTAGYHQSTWSRIGRTVNPIIQRYAPFLNTPVTAEAKKGRDKRRGETKHEIQYFFTADMQSSSEIHHHERCRPVFPTENIGPADSDKGKVRRRVLRKSSAPQICRQQSFGRDIGHAAAETYLITRLSFDLLGYLGVGYRWITRLLALACYAILLMPGFLQVAYHYFFSPQVRRSIVYGDQPRNRLDLYIPPPTSAGLKPVVVFVTGGAWIIGYKAWGSLLGLQLAERDIIVACLDYRNFPQGTISDMVRDVSQGISFVCNNISAFGGDPNRIYLMGQSAGAHISSCALIEQAIKESRGERISWSASQIKAYFGLSGGYNLFNMVEHFHNRGLYRSIFLSIMEGEESFEQYSPGIRLKEPRVRKAASLLTHIVLFHGSEDYSIPCEASKTFAEALQGVEVKTDLIIYNGKTHTDLFLQDPLRGGKDELFDHIVSMIHANDSDGLSKDAVAPPRRRLVPEILLKLAGKVSPF
ncbi:hypothetical protein IGI04_021074 [Brassica rapa subsp. trilocularis]|uniref:protein-S-isoprenylcysteine alpha-carbonyl methylesterase n=1 Tax=Brassica rapa subsp. trilocularis TaxID=1813537 RepID=A0ABQ7MLA1_BRACM|nr:hypothetical protein IGI04_021074 [Brassica rapa subsp. trilocularis]